MPIDDPNVLLKDPEMSRDFLNHVFGTTPDPEPKPADAKHLEGQEVVIHGLKGRPELNGQRGRALKWNPESRRIGVEVEGMGKLSVKADNVRLPNAEDAARKEEIEKAAAPEAEAEPQGRELMIALSGDCAELREALASLHMPPTDPNDPAVGGTGGAVSAALQAATPAGSAAVPIRMLQTDLSRPTRAGCRAVQEVAVRPEEVVRDESTGTLHRVASPTSTLPLSPEHRLPSAAGAKALTGAVHASLHAPEAKVAAQALETLAALSHASMPGKLELLKASSGPAAVAAMGAHPSEAEVQSAGARMLANLANGDAACKQAALEAGALKVVAAAMRAHKDRLSVVVMGCGVLANLANGDPACQAAVLEASGPKLLAAALQAYPQSPDVQHQGCLGLANLAAGGRHQGAAAAREAVCDVGGAAAAVRALRLHGKEIAEVRQWGLGLLSNIASGDAECKQAVADAGGAAALARALQEHTEDVGVARLACGALAHVAQDDEAREAVLGTAAPAAVVGAMGCHVADAQLQEEACFCLVQLAWGGGALGKRAAIEAGAMPSLALVLATHTEPRHQKLQQMAKAILEELEKARHAQ